MGVDPAGEESRPITRTSMNGQVPEDMTYIQWLRKQDGSVVKEALGPTRAKLFREGNLDVGTFTDRRGRVLNLEKLKRREADVFEELGV